ncbi:MAG: UvrB/UvrC motif-containing protein, partial [Bacillota bacterium]|nr:UvrB/UvrC motif-containing protein [Bacillota bacterium]
SPLELTKKELAAYIKQLEKEMKQAAKRLDFEKAAELRDMIMELRTQGRAAARTIEQETQDNA